MARRDVAPTKSNLLGLRQELEFARQGYELLDQKRNILVIELLGLVDQAESYELQVEEALSAAYEDFRSAVLASGRLTALYVSSAINIDADIQLTRRKVMGVRLPVVETSFTEHAPYYSPMGTTHHIDKAVASFKEALELMGRLAELKVSITRLASEVKKTIRKVNALDKVAIPELDETVAAIQERLEENERDMFVLMKMVKSRLEKKRR